MNRCKDCKHWDAKPDKDPRYEGSMHRACGRMPGTGDMYLRYDEERPEQDAELRERYNSAPYCGDLSGCGFFMTPPDFGCTLWETKE